MRKFMGIQGKRFFCVFLAAVMLLLTIPEINTRAAQPMQTGILLDCARRYYSVSSIKKYIKMLSASKNSFLQLHLTDDQNVGIECLALGQTVKKAKKLSDGSYKNPKTNQKFLSREQIRELISYAKKRNVELIPEIDMPAHMGGFFKLAAISKGEKYVTSISADTGRYPGELKISSKKGMDFAKMLYSEYAKLFSDCKYFHMGCDEFFSGSQSSIITYINTMSKYLRSKGFTVCIWNDLLRKDNIKKVTHKVQVTYWSYDGDTQNPSLRKQRRKERASVPDLQKEGFLIYNYNSYYLYVTPSRENCTKENRNYMVSDLKKNWNIRMWDGDTGKKLTSTKNLMGAAVCVWGEDSAGVTATDIYKQIEPLYKAMKNSM